jgi:hypothetical protein
MWLTTPTLDIHRQGLIKTEQLRDLAIYLLSWAYSKSPPTSSAVLPSSLSPNFSSARVNIV